MSLNKSLEYARNLQEKYEFYLVALTFTILGLSIQTAKFGNNIYADIAEILGWFFLLSSGVFALMRLEMLPVAYKNSARITFLKEETKGLQNQQVKGASYVVLSDHNMKEVSIQTAIIDRQTAISTAEPTLKALEKCLIIKYYLHKWGFIIGSSLLVISRSLDPISKILTQLY